MSAQIVFGPWTTTKLFSFQDYFEHYYIHVCMSLLSKAVAPLTNIHFSYCDSNLRKNIS